MVLMRLGMPERSHLIEYSILALFVYRTLLERFLQEGPSVITAWWTWCITLALGVLDEILQIWVTDRVFDTEDIVFNGSAALMAVVSILVLQWIRRRIRET